MRLVHRQSLHPEWNELAKKQLKGADPEEKLTWATPEVVLALYCTCLIYVLFSFLFYRAGTYLTGM